MRAGGAHSVNIWVDRLIGKGCILAHAAPISVAADWLWPCIAPDGERSAIGGRQSHDHDFMNRHFLALRPGVRINGYESPAPRVRLRSARFPFESAFGSA